MVPNVKRITIILLLSLSVHSKSADKPLVVFTGIARRKEMERKERKMYGG